MAFHYLYSSAATLYTPDILKEYNCIRNESVRSVSGSYVLFNGYMPGLVCVFDPLNFCFQRKSQLFARGISRSLQTKLKSCHSGESRARPILLPDRTDTKETLLIIIKCDISETTIED